MSILTLGWKSFIKHESSKYKGNTWKFDLILLFEITHKLKC